MIIPDDGIDNYEDFRRLRAVGLSKLVSALCVPLIGFRECYKNIDPAREMTPTELKMYAAGGAIRG